MRAGVIGLGDMGSGLAKNLLKKQNSTRREISALSFPSDIFRWACLR